MFLENVASARGAAELERATKVGNKNCVGQRGTDLAPSDIVVVSSSWKEISQTTSSYFMIWNNKCIAWCHRISM